MIQIWFCGTIVHTLWIYFFTVFFETVKSNVEQMSFSAILVLWLVTHKLWAMWKAGPVALPEPTSSQNLNFPLFQTFGQVVLSVFFVFLHVVVLYFFNFLKLWVFAFNYTIFPVFTDSQSKIRVFLCLLVVFCIQTFVFSHFMITPRSPISRLFQTSVEQPAGWKHSWIGEALCIFIFFSPLFYIFLYFCISITFHDYSRSGNS